MRHIVQALPTTPRRNDIFRKLRRMCDVSCQHPLCVPHRSQAVTSIGLYIMFCTVPPAVQHQPSEPYFDSFASCTRSSSVTKIQYRGLVCSTLQNTWSPRWSSATGHKTWPFPSIDLQKTHVCLESSSSCISCPTDGGFTKTKTSIPAIHSHGQARTNVQASRNLHSPKITLDISQLSREIPVVVFLDWFRDPDIPNCPALLPHFSMQSVHLGRIVNGASFCQA